MLLRKKKSRSGFTLIELLVVIAIIAVLAGLIAPAAQRARTAVQKSQCQNNLHQIGTALHNYHESKKKLPVGLRPFASSTVRASAFTQLLPFIDQKALWDKYDTNVNWSNAANTPVSSLSIQTYLCASAPHDVQDHNPDGYTSGGAWTPLVAVGDYGASLGVHPGMEAVGAALSPAVAIAESNTTFTDLSQGLQTNGFLPKNSVVTFADVTDGIGNTIAIFESGGRPYHYVKGARNASLPEHHVNAGGWARPASDILFRGSTADGASFPGTYVNRTNGFDCGGQDYTASGFSSPIGTEGSSQPYSFHDGGFNVLFGDGAVKFIADDVAIGVISALVTRNQSGAEVLVSSQSY